MVSYSSSLLLVWCKDRLLLLQALLSGVAWHGVSKAESESWEREERGGLFLLQYILDDKPIPQAKAKAGRKAMQEAFVRASRPRNGRT